MIAAVSRRRRRRNHVATPVAASAAIADVRTLELAAIEAPDRCGPASTYDRDARDDRGRGPRPASAPMLTDYPGRLLNHAEIEHLPMRAS